MKLMKIIDEELYENFFESFENPDVSDEQKKFLAIIASISPLASRLAYKISPADILNYDIFNVSALKAEINALTCIEDEHLFSQNVRRFKYRELLKLIVRDVYGHNSVEKTLNELSFLADIVINAVANFVSSKYSMKKLLTLSIIAMGKLGACELNFSSDVDLVYVYEDTDINNVEDYNKQAIYINRLLASLTKDGFLYRVDNDLRPGGKFSPLAMSGEAVLNHYFLYGETWQRVALLRARFLYGNELFVSELVSELMSFIYRKYLDFSMIKDLRALKEKINKESLKKDKEGINIKLGRGGIREAEFFVQVLQIINGGKDVNLRKVKIADAVDALSQKNIITKAQGETLKHAYYFLRKVENSIQMEEERQEYLLPTNPIVLNRVVKRCGYEDIKNFLDELNFHRDNVKNMFDELFSEKIKSGVVDKQMTSEEFIEQIRGNTPFQKELINIAENLYLLHENVVTKYREEYLKVVLELFKMISNREGSENILKNMEEFFKILTTRPIYIPLLAENPVIIRKIIDIFSFGKYLSQFIITHPEVLDFIVANDNLKRESFEDYLKFIRQIESGVLDFEEKMFLIRQFKNSEWLKIALLNFSGTITNKEMELYLTNLAEALLLVVFDLCEENIKQKFGEIKQEYAIIGMGKLGTQEMNFFSDLDIIFVYRSNDERASVYNTKLLQRVITGLTTTTKEGYLYKVDMRLRPTGSQGPLVTTVENFVNYHKESSWLFEKQALTKARVLGFKNDLSEELEKYIEDILYKDCQDEKYLKQEIDSMRKKIEKELSLNTKCVDAVSVKTGQGGLIDIEFIVQFFKLCYGCKYTELRTRNTDDFLNVLSTLNLVPSDWALELLKSYRFLKKIETNLRLYAGYAKESFLLSDEVAKELVYSLGYTGKAVANFFRDVKATTRNVRNLYKKIFSC